MIQEYKEKFVNTPYWDKAFDIAYEVKDKDLSAKEMCVVSFLKAIEFIKSINIDEEKLDAEAIRYHRYADIDIEAFKAGVRKAKELFV